MKTEPGWSRSPKGINMAAKSLRRTGAKAKNLRNEFESYTLVTVFTPQADGSYKREEFPRASH